MARAPGERPSIDQGVFLVHLIRARKSLREGRLPDARQEIEHAQMLRPEDEVVWKSLRNLGHVHICGVGELNAYDVLVADWVIFTPDTLPTDTPVTRGTHETEDAS